MKLLLFSNWLLAWTVVSAAGCALVGEQESAPTLSANGQHETVRISYHSESDRLNAWAAGDETGRPVVQAAWLPAVSSSKLEILHPHPDGTPGYALAKVVVTPLEKLGQGGSEATWRLDVPQEHLGKILGKLRQQGFFDDSKSVDPAVFLKVELDGTRFGKEFRAVPELDAVVLRTRQKGRQTMPDGLASQLRRLPPVE